MAVHSYVDVTTDYKTSANSIVVRGYNGRSIEDAQTFDVTLRIIIV